MIYACFFLKLHLLKNQGEVDLDKMAVVTHYYSDSKLFHVSMYPIMGTQLDVLMLGESEMYLQSVWQKMEREVTMLHIKLNRFDKQSEIAYLNREAPFHPVVVSEELWLILQDSLRYCQLTRGYFDITVRNFKHVLLDEIGQTVFFLSKSLYIDFGGLGKGYVLRRFKYIMEQCGIKSALINFGNSSVLALGTHPFGAYWPVGVVDPYTKRQIDNLHLTESSLSVSGNMPSHPRHIINPFTGKYVEDRKMVAIVAPDPVDAEVLTTALMVVDDENLIHEITKNFDISEKHFYSL